MVCFRLYVNWRFMRGIEAQFLALQKGFSELIPQHLLKPFDHKELEVRVLPLEKGIRIHSKQRNLNPLSSIFSVDNWWTWKDRPCRLEKQHAPETLHK